MIREFSVGVVKADSEAGSARPAVNIKSRRKLKADIGFGRGGEGGWKSRDVWSTSSQKEGVGGITGKLCMMRYVDHHVCQPTSIFEEIYENRIT